MDLNDVEQSWPDPSWLAEAELRHRLAQLSLIDHIRVLADDGTTVALFDVSGTLEGASGAPQPPADAPAQVRPPLARVPLARTFKSAAVSEKNRERFQATWNCPKGLGAKEIG